MGRDSGQLTVIYCLAAFIRYFLSISEFQSDIASRIEISTPLNSMKRVIEGKYRMTYEVDPYQSDILHEPPSHLKFYSILLDLGSSYVPLIFILIDILTAHVLYVFARRYLLNLYIKQEIEKVTYAMDATSQLLFGKKFSVPPIYMTVVFLFNPYTIFNCVAMTTTTINNFVLAIYLTGIAYSNPMISIPALACITVQSFYPVILAAPIYITAYRKNNSHIDATKVILSFIMTLLGMLVYSKTLHNGWGFLEQTYGFILQVTDQQPNIGVFWYFFMEMFEHFRLLFLFAYQMNVTILYFVPLTIKFRKDPALLAACFISLIAIFKSYPSIGDFAFTLALLPCWMHLYSCMQQIFISSIAIVVTTSLAPILWDLWIFWGTANANFFFGATLAFITAHIFLVTDISFAHTKREYLLKYGFCRRMNGKDAKLVLE